MNTLLYIALQGIVEKAPLPQEKTGFLKLGLNITFAIVGAVAVLIIVLSGMRLVFARDNPENISKARNSVIYAVIGLIIVASAAFIVNNVIGRLD